jgi:molecular chaperone DnaK (HSP70)
MTPIVGIDLGTTNSLVAVCDDKGPRIIPDALGRPLLPSVVRYEVRGERAEAVARGYEARAHAPEDPANTISSVKRLMGRSIADAAPDLPFLSYSVVAGDHNTARVALQRRGSPEAESVVLSPQEVSAEILRALREQASRALGMEVTRAVVTVPAYFDDAQRQATRDAGRIAGLEVVRIVPEPTAAALAYGLGLKDAATQGPPGSATRTTTPPPPPSTIAVFDLGGGTFDISILKLTGGDTDIFQVLATAGDTHLGGDDVDNLIVNLLLSDPSLSHRRGALTPAELSGLKLAAERAKCELSEREQTAIDLPSGTARELSRAELESLMTPWVDRALDICGRALRDAARQLDITPEALKDTLDSVIMVGGSTRIPLIRRRVGEFFGRAPYTALDPDQVVALGAAVQAGILSGTVRGALLLDVIPLSLGIETAGGAVAKIIFRNSTVPARATEMFSTSVDGQTSIKLHILQGEREMVEDCRSLGTFHLRGLPPMPAGIPQVEVEFLVDANGVLNVSAHERRSGRRAQLQVIPNHGLTREEVARMEADSLTHARDDMTRHRIADLIVNSKLDIKWIGERLAKYESKLDADYAADLKAQLAALKSRIESAERDWKSVDPDEFYRAKNALDQTSIRLQEVGISESLRNQPGA